MLMAIVSSVRVRITGPVRVIMVMMMLTVIGSNAAHNYGAALSKCILFFEGQRSGKLPASQRMTWRKDSALQDGRDAGVDLVGGYYDAGDNVKFHFPMAFTTTMLAWSVLEFGSLMGPDTAHALDAIRWGTDYFLRATSKPGVVFAQVGEPHGDHNCWERPEDMDTPRTTYAVNSSFPGSEVSGEIAAALASSSSVFKGVDPAYSQTLLDRAKQVFKFADKHRGSYNTSLGAAVCPFYCNFGGYKDELIWAAAWLYKATETPYYWSYVVNETRTSSLHRTTVKASFHGSLPSKAASFGEFGWDTKDAGINILVSKFLMKGGTDSSLFLPQADRLVCATLPDLPTKLIQYSPGGLMFKPGGGNLQHVTAMSYLLLVYSRYLSDSNRTVQCGDRLVPPNRLVQVARSQVDYILGSNPLGMSYMIGYGNNFPKRIHHRGSSLPSLDRHPGKIACKGGTPYFESPSPNPNELTGAIVGGPDVQDWYNDSRADPGQSEVATYYNAPFVGVLAYFRSNPNPS